jgi:hypothetical protein
MTISHGPPNARKTYEQKFDPPMLPGQARTRLEGLYGEAKDELAYVRLTVPSYSSLYRTDEKKGEGSPP